MTLKKIGTIALSTILIMVLGCSKKSVPTASKQSKGMISAAVALSPIELEGQKIYSEKCGRCHSLKDPSEYTAKEWIPIMNSMANKARLTDAEKSSVTAYVNKNARVN